MLHRLLRTLRRLFSRWFSSRPAPDRVEEDSGSLLVIEATPLQPISEPRDKDDVHETYSEPAIVIEVRPR